MIRHILCRRDCPLQKCFIVLSLGTLISLTLTACGGGATPPAPFARESSTAPHPIDTPIPLIPDVKSTGTDTHASSLTPTSNKIHGTTTIEAQTMSSDVNINKLDPFFYASFDEVIESEVLSLHICFETSPDEDIIREIEHHSISMQTLGQIAGPIEVPCWAIFASISPESLPVVSQMDEPYKLVLIDPAPKGDYLLKLDSIVQFLSKYRPNSQNLDVFVYVEKEVDESKFEEWKNLGLTLNLDSWIPPTTSHPTGYYGGEVLVSNIVELSKLKDIVRIVSAETQVFPSMEEQLPGGGYEPADISSGG